MLSKCCQHNEYLPLRIYKKTQCEQLLNVFIKFILETLCGELTADAYGLPLFGQIF